MRVMRLTAACGIGSDKGRVESENSVVGDRHQVNYTSLIHSRLRVAQIRTN